MENEVSSAITAMVFKETYRSAAFHCGGGTHHSL